ncbi:MAG: site-2 protease family protein [Bifidobacteriaceae bacterium]|jgi:membrane-associated protease RseP (regulator of RpoE activity)|nr:site-2 protease family protein [Bifidobacteriaceae bacterium]
MLLGIITIVILVIGVTISVTIHEAGHTFTAKAFGVPVSEFMVGFGPTLISKKIGETVYGFKPILLGGYSKILGMFPPAGKKWKDKGPFAKMIKDVRAESADTLPEDQESRAFYWLSTPKKIIVMAGGTLMNLLLGFIFFALAFCSIGAFRATTTVDSIVPCVTNEQKCEPVDYSPAAKAGLQSDDKIISLDGQAINSWSDITNIVAASEGKTMELVFEAPSSGTKVKTSITPAPTSSGYKIGILSKQVRQSANLSDAANITWQAFSGTAQMVVTLPYQTFKAVSSIFTHEPRTGNGVLSLVGVGQIAVDQTAATDDNLSRIASMLSLLGSLNIALFVLNLIPLLPLDGGHVVNALYEGAVRLSAKLRKKPRPAPSDLARSMPLAYFVYGLLIFCGFALILVDIINPIKL